MIFVYLPYFYLYDQKKKHTIKTQIIIEKESKICCNNSFAFFFDDYLCFDSMLFLFSGIVLFLSFFGRWIGVSVASIIIVLSLKCLFINVFFAQQVVEN